jgi:hypothetical protein
MTNNSTLKRNLRFRRKTNKKSKYGGMETSRPSQALRVNAPAFVPSAPLNITAEPYIPAGMSQMNMISMFMRFMTENAVAIDCEMVGVGPSRANALVHVAIVDFMGNEIYNKYVIPKDGINSITNERFQYSGVSKNLLRDYESRGLALPYEQVKYEVAAILDGKKIVGHGLDNDFAVLEYMPNPFMIWDTTKIPEYLRNNGSAQKLKHLASKIGNNIQKNNGKGHSPLEDARASMNLYRVHNSYEKIPFKNMRL